MRNTEQTLNTAIGELRCLNPNGPATLEELVALSAARACIEQMLQSCVDELRTHPDITYSWATLAYALGSPSTSDARQQYGISPTDADVLLRSFWQTFASSFVWDLLPVSFLYELYSRWMDDEHPGIAHANLSKSAFTRKLKAAATTTGQWIYTRSRPGSLMNAAEPLAARLSNWSPDESGAAIYGLRRHTATQEPSGTPSSHSE